MKSLSKLFILQVGSLGNLGWNACSLQLPVLRRIFKISRKKGRRSARKNAEKRHKNRTNSRLPYNNRSLVSLPLTCQQKMVSKGISSVLIAHSDTRLHLASEPVSFIKNSLSKLV